MNFIDIIILIPLLWFAYKGFSKGLIVEITTLIALVLGIYLANNLSNLTADFLVEKFNLTSEYLDIIAFSITFILVVIAAMLLGKAITKLINAIQLSFLNKLAGALFSIIKISFLISILIMIIAQFELEDIVLTDEQRKGSLLYEPVKKVAPTIIPGLKENDSDLIENVKENLDNQIERVNNRDSL